VLKNGCEMLFRVVVLASVASVSAWGGCYGGPACVTAGTPHGCYDCSMTEAQCTTASKTWQPSVTANATDGTDLCAAGTPVVMGCFARGRYGSSCDCSAKYGNDYATSCTGQWKQCKDASGTGCDVLPTAELLAARSAPVPPSSPPLPPSLPPAPPQKCIPVLNTDKPAKPEDPVNEPCYDGTTCVRVDPATGLSTGVISRGVCCVKVGTCQGMTVSGTSRYFEGGCVPAFVASGLIQTKAMKFYKPKTVANTSTSTDYPTTTEGCVKQGECVLPYMELSKVKDSPNYGISGAGGGGQVATPSDATMDRLLAGAIEAQPGACRDFYPRTTVTATHHVTASITVEAELSSFTTTVLTAMEAKVASEMKVAPGNVDIKAEAGSVVLTINIGYDSAATAATAKTTMATAMSDNTAAAAMLSTDTMAIASVTAVGKPTSGSGSTASPPPPAVVPAKTDSDDGLSVGAIAGIAVGASVGVILVAGVAIFMMNKKKTVTPTKGQP